MLYLGRALGHRQVHELESKIKNDALSENYWIKYTAKKLGSTVWCCVSKYLHNILTSTNYIQNFMSLSITISSGILLLKTNQQTEKRSWKLM